MSFLSPVCFLVRYVVFVEKRQHLQKWLVGPRGHGTHPNFHAGLRNGIKTNLSLNETGEARPCKKHRRGQERDRRQTETEDRVRGQRQRQGRDRDRDGNRDRDRDRDRRPRNIDMGNYIEAEMGGIGPRT
jgi:hypothetical protein